MPATILCWSSLTTKSWTCLSNSCIKLPSSVERKGDVVARLFIDMIVDFKVVVRDTESNFIGRRQKS